MYMNVFIRSREEEIFKNYICSFNTTDSMEEIINQENSYSIKGKEEKKFTENVTLDKMEFNYNDMFETI